MKRLLVLAFLSSAAVWAGEDLPPYYVVTPSTVSAVEVAPPPGADRAAKIQQMWDDGHRSEAERESAQWLKTDDKSPWPWVTAAGLSFRQKKWGKCFSLANAALKRDPNLADAYYWRGRYYEKKKKPLEAANEYRAAVEAQSSHQAAKDGLARLRPQLGETDDAARSN